MKRNCLQVEEEIWEHARSGREMSLEARRHIEECRECAKALREAGQIQRAIGSAIVVPDSPDCREVVLAGISSRKILPVWGWAGACAAVLAAVVLAWSILGAPDSKPQVRPEQMMAKDTPAKRAPVEQLIPREAPGEVEGKADAVDSVDDQTTSRATEQKPVAKKIRYYHQPRLKHQAPIDQGIVEEIVKGPDTPPSAPDSAENSAAADAERPVAIAIVEWPSEMRGDEPLAYSYTQRDPKTGETTNCAVRWSNGSVEIDMETREEDTRPKTIKGSIDDETHRNV